VIAHTVTPFNRAGGSSDGSAAGGNGDASAVVDVDVDAGDDGDDSDGPNVTATLLKQNLISHNVTIIFFAFPISIAHSLDIIICSHAVKIKDTAHAYSAHNSSTTAHIRTGKTFTRAGRATCM
jgi:hypothetical protein